MRLLLVGFPRTCRMRSWSIIGSSFWKGFRSGVSAAAMTSRGPSCFSPPMLPTTSQVTFSSLMAVNRLGSEEKIMNIPLTPLRFLRYAEQQYPNETAVVCGDLRLTYEQFADRANRLAGAIRNARVAPGERVAFLSTNCH